MVAGCSEGIHWLAACFLGRRAVRAARHTGVSGVFALWRPHKERPRAQLFAYDAQQLGASSTALWQPGFGPVPKQNLEVKKLPNLATVTY